MENREVIPPEQGVLLGKYHLISAIGHGGMADVHLARVAGPAGVDKLVVVKQIRRELVDDAEILSMFLDEARIAARLTHSNVVQTYEVAQDGDRYFIAMEFLDGQPLSRVRSRLQAEGGLPLGMHLRVIVDVLAGLHHAHELADFDGTPLHVVHRDVTPHNVFVTYDGTVKVVDFGIAKARFSMAETRAGFFKGKVTYIAPEQALGLHVDRRADVFTAGVMLWEAVTGKRPWAGLDDIAILKSGIEGRFPSAREANPAVSDEMVAILDKALAFAREDRYATAAELQADIEAYLDRSGERSHPRDLGRLVAHHFAVERAQVRALIEHEVRADRAVESEKRARARTPAAEPDRPAPPEHEPGRAGSLTSVATSTVTPPRPWRRHALEALGVVAVLALAAGAARSWSGRAREAHAGPPASAPAPAPAPAAIRLEIHAVPDHATVYVDRVDVGSDPILSLGHDGAEHEIRVEAPGHAPSVERLVFDRDHTLRIALRPLPAATASAGPPPAPRRPAPARKHPALHPVDERNPYAM